MPHTYCGTTKYIVIVERLCHERIEDISLFSRRCGRNGRRGTDGNYLTKYTDNIASESDALDYVKSWHTI
jgi:hypothetical protein